MKFLASSLLLLSFNAIASGNINPFTTDGCSKFIDGPVTGNGYEWLHCCEQHDVKYWSGLGGQTAQDEADLEIRQCVTNAGFPWYGETIYRALLAARPVNAHTNVSYRWGYGWNEVLHQRELTKNELESLKQMTSTITTGIANYRNSKGHPAPTPEQQESMVRIIDKILTSENPTLN
ncbi:MAG: hypothetical protein A4S09_13070 [Proteobacteria bacterium SG_bin7]|nr:MAG: hypothetical protein A4S09_13070 [Proteobacteria bacterium SG_bin7]